MPVRGAAGSGLVEFRFAGGAPRGDLLSRCDGADVLGFVALAAGADLELDGLPLRKSRPGGRQVRDVNEHVLTTLAGDETETSVVIEELHFALHNGTNLSVTTDQRGRPVETVRPGDARSSPRFVACALTVGSRRNLCVTP